MPSKIVSSRVIYHEGEEKYELNKEGIITTLTDPRIRTTVVHKVEGSVSLEIVTIRGLHNLNISIPTQSLSQY